MDKEDPNYMYVKRTGSWHFVS